MRLECFIEQWSDVAHRSSIMCLIELVGGAKACQLEVFDMTSFFVKLSSQTTRLPTGAECFSGIIPRAPAGRHH